MKYIMKQKKNVSGLMFDNIVHFIVQHQFADGFGQFARDPGPALRCRTAAPGLSDRTLAVHDSAADFESDRGCHVLVLTKIVALAYCAAFRRACGHDLVLQAVTVTVSDCVSNRGYRAQHDGDWLTKATSLHLAPGGAWSLQEAK